jgi:hypothetical protein
MDILRFMQNIPPQRNLRWTPDELSFGRLTSNYVSRFGWEPGTDWSFDEVRQEYRCTFGNGRHSISVLFSRNEVLAEHGGTMLSAGIRRKMDDAMGRQAGALPSSRQLA